jgi:hypothetical protein
LIALPVVHEVLWERVARDFDDVGPEACLAEILDDLLAYNPHYLEMALRCARDIGDPQRILTGLAMFYRILYLAARERGGVPPRITLETRDVIASMIGEFGDEQFVLLATETLQTENPCLLQMADSFASRHHDYLGIMQGFVMLYKALSAQAVIDGLGIAVSRDIDRPKGLPAPDS